MRELKKRIEMLDEACKQLDKRTDTGDRLALILLDNLAEITMYEKVRYLFAHDSQFKNVIPPKYSDKLRKKVLWEYSEKVDLLVRDTEALSEDQGNVLKIGHVLRNESYHRGEIRIRIIRKVALTYLKTACDIVPNLWSGILMFTPGEDIGGYLKQFGIDATMIDRDVLDLVCNHFLVERECCISELTDSLAADLTRRIEEVISGCEYLAENAHEKTSSDEVLKNLQFNPQFHEKHKFDRTDEGFRKFVRTRKKEFSEYIPPITIPTLNNCKDQAESISLVRYPGEALKLYADLDRMFSDIEETVGQAVYEFDEWVNMQVHDGRL